MGFDRIGAGIDLDLLDIDILEIRPAVTGNGVVLVQDIHPLLDIGRQLQLRLDIAHGSGEDRDGRSHGHERLHAHPPVQHILAEAKDIIEGDHRPQGMSDNDALLHPVLLVGFELLIDAPEDAHRAGALIPFILEVIEDLDDHRIDAGRDQAAEEGSFLGAELEGQIAVGQVSGGVSPEQLVLHQARGLFLGLLGAAPALLQQGPVLLEHQLEEAAAVTGDLMINAVDEDEVQRHLAPFPVTIGPIIFVFCLIIFSQNITVSIHFST